MIPDALAETRRLAEEEAAFENETPAFLRITPEQIEAGWVRMQMDRERKNFQPWDEIISRVKAHEFQTMKALAAAYDKPKWWPAKLGKLLVAQKVMKLAEWKSCFRRRDGNPHSDLRLSATPSRGTNQTPRLSREGFEKVFLEKDGCLTFDLVLQMLRLGCWKRVDEFGRNFKKPVWWVSSFRRFLIREGIVTRKEWTDWF